MRFAEILEGSYWTKSTLASKKDGKQGNTFFQNRAELSRKGIKSKPIDKDKFFGKKDDPESGDLDEGYFVLPAMDRERYTEIKGLEGPFMTRSSKVVYYDPKEGKYYDRDSDMYLSHQEYEAYDSPSKNIKETELTISKVTGNKAEAGDGIEIDLDKVDLSMDDKTKAISAVPKGSKPVAQDPRAQLKPGTKISVGTV
tara:strand:+ start:1677 stop:2270 length:594 start_codon:yes stop_codon:yes gene_type:complete